MLSRQKSRVAAFAADATRQKTRLMLLQNGMHTWKQQTFGRPDTLILAFIAGVAVAPSGRKKNDAERGKGEGGQRDDGQREDKGPGLPVKALEAAFLAWRLFGQQVDTGAAASKPSADGSVPG